MREPEAPQLVKVYGTNVLIRSGGVTYSDTLAHFEADSGAPFDNTLPEGFERWDGQFVGRSYIPGDKHRITTGHKAIQLPRPWDYAETLFPQVARLVAAKEAREALEVPPAPPGLQQDRLAAFEALMARKAAEPDASQEEKDYQQKRGERGVAESPGRS